MELTPEERYRIYDEERARIEGQQHHSVHSPEPATTPALYVVGRINGSKTYESQAGWTITIPWLKAEGMFKPGDAVRLMTAVKRTE